MAESKLKEFAELLGVEIGVPFNIKGYMYNPCILTDSKIMNRHGVSLESTLFRLLNGELEIEQQILDDIEKRYLENVLRPFKDRVIYVRKFEAYDCDYEFITYQVLLPLEKNLRTSCKLPCFKKGTMYKRMEVYKEYSLKELGLFESDGE